VIPELETPVTATLSFLPTASAVMAVAELLKTAAPGYPRNANFACLDFLGPLPDFVVVRHAPQRACVCGGQRPVWESLNGKTRFAPISM
jgi:hypothetical protein